MGVDEKSLREVCDMLNVTRRAIQGYEVQGLVKATGKNKQGYLLYDSTAQERIRRISQLQRFGFRVKEIASLLELPEEDLKKRLEEQTIELNRKLMNLDRTIKELSDEIARIERETAE